MLNLPSRNLCRWIVVFTCLALPQSLFACPFHNQPGFGYLPMGSHPDFQAVAARGMLLEALPKHRVAVGVESQASFTVVVPESYRDVSVKWAADENLELTGEIAPEVSSGMDKEFTLTFTPKKPGTYLLRGKLKGYLDGKFESKSSFVFIEVVPAEELYSSN